MKHLLTGVAMAAALAIAAPAAWAQGSAPMTPSAPKPAPAAKAPAAKPMSTGTMAKKPMRMRHHHMMHRMSSGDQMTDQLNQQELQRIMGGGAPGPAPMPMSPGGNNPTSGASGPFAPAGSAPPPPAK